MPSMPIPPLLTTLSGCPVEQRDTWEPFRRREILTLFRDFVYGAAPIGTPAGLRFQPRQPIPRFHDRPLTFQEIELSIPGYSFPVWSFVPESDHPLPAFVYVMHEYQQQQFQVLEEPNFSCVPVLDITSRGYALFVMPTSGICPDYDHESGCREGIYTVLGPAPEDRTGRDWATISAWAWGACRVLDYVVTDPRIDPKQVAVAGHSRGGKTALWAAAQDARFAMAVSNSSGCMGAAILRGKTGERVKNINNTDWFCGNFHSFNDREDLLPVDQHMLLALLAPRLLYVQSSSWDDWADPAAERLGCRLASEVYEKVYGLPGVRLPAEAEVAVDTPYHDGRIGYHMRTGDHAITPRDWQQFMDFWDRHRNK